MSTQDSEKNTANLCEDRKPEQEVACPNVGEGNDVNDKQSRCKTATFLAIGIGLLLVVMAVIWGLEERKSCEQNFPVTVEKNVTVEKSDADFLQTNAGDRAILKLDGVEFAFRYCPVGTFMMGSPEDERGRGDLEQKQHSERISEGFWICETETTQEQWDAVGVKRESERYQKQLVDKYGFDEERSCERTKLPVEDVSLNEIDAFVKKLNALGTAPEGWRWALPTEEQWEYACLAGTNGSTYAGSIDEYFWYFSNSGEKKHDVGTKKPNDWGIYDMLGNVWEWTSSKNENATSFVIRGGGCCDGLRCCRPTFRSYYYPSHWNCNLGFRTSLVRSQLK